jgi:hypothetical protein
MSKSPARTQATTTERSEVDDDVRAILDQAEAGIADLMAIYERTEGIYFAAAAASAPAPPSPSYSTHT